MTDLTEVGARFESRVRRTMDSSAIILVSVAVIAYGLLSAPLSRSILTAPLAFAGFGFAIGPGGFGLVEIDLTHDAIHMIAEVTLVLVLFTDAARIDLRRLAVDHDLPLRMLAIGLPLTVALGALVAYGLFPDLGLVGALLLSATLAPTDAALGQAVVTDPGVPVRVRQAINVESGLNDGIVLPVVLIFVALATASAAEPAMASSFVKLGLLQVTLGPLAGVTVGIVGARLIDRAATAGVSTRSFEGMAVLALSLLSFAIAETIGGNGFIAAFTAGLSFGGVARDRCEFVVEFMETEGQLLTLMTFLIFGAAMVPEAIRELDASVLTYAVLSLTVVRMVPIALSLLGSGVGAPTRLFLGWFGPRGLASILFALLILEEADIPYRSEILTVTIATVALSVILHGVTAAPFARRYGAHTVRMGDGAENMPVMEMPLRHGNAPTR